MNKPNHNKLPPKKLNLRIFNKLLECYGPRKWWPGEAGFEVIAGAILAQSVAWENAETAINNLKTDGMLSVPAIRSADVEDIALRIKSSRFYRQKAVRLKTFCAYLENNYGGSLERMFAVDADELREELLSLRGIGKETADCILLYAGSQLSFVSDFYTARFLERYGIINGAGYDEIRGYFMENLPRDVYIYNEFHALIVHHCKNVCRTSPLCGECPVKQIGSGLKCHFGNSNHACKNKG